MTDKLATTEVRKTWVDLFNDNKAAFKDALPRVGLTPEKMIQVVSTAMRMNPDLKKCTPASLISCMLQSCELGLSPSSTLGMAYLVPFNNTKKGVKECTFLIGYKGLVALARRSGEIRALRTEVVHDNEQFELPLSLGDRIKHQALAPGQRGKKIGAYAEAELKDGGYQYIFLWADDVMALRKRSKASASGPWITDEDEMWKKSAIRRLCKLLPMAAEDARQISEEEYRDMGIMPSDLDVEDGTVEVSVEPAPSLEGSVQIEGEKNA